MPTRARLLRRLALVSVAIAALSGCGDEPAAYAPPPPPEVTVAPPVAREVPNTLDFTGTVRANQRVELRPRVGGFLDAKLVDDGQRVSAGDVLFEIDPRTYEAEAAQAEAELSARQADARLAEVSLTRTRMALEQGAGNQQELDRAIATRDAAVAAVELAEARLARARLDIEFTKVVTPIDGRIGFLYVEVGDLIGGAPVSETLATVIDDSRVFAVYDIDEQTIFELRRRQSNRRPGEDGRPTHEVRIQQAGEQGFPHSGRFISADNTINPDTGTIRVEAVFENEDGSIIPGAFVRIRAFLGERSALLVPETSVLVDQGGRYVMMVDAENTARRVGVERVGDPIDGLQPINELVPEGAEPLLSESSRIIVNGLQRARPGAPVTPLTAEQAAAARAAAASAGTSGGGE